MSDQQIVPVDELAGILDQHREEGRRIVHCHGVFDLLHIGHIKHIQKAATLGDVLVVTLTPDRYVNKGPHRPAFTEALRAEALAALECVAHVAINRWPTAVELIHLLKPDVYVKGGVDEKGPRDHTDAIQLEAAAVQAVGGELVLTQEETYSASTLINQHLSVMSPEANGYLEGFRSSHSEADVLESLSAVRGLKTLIIGETIIDEYQFCNVMSKSNKDPILAAKYLYHERYAGGVLAIANHLAGFCDDITMLSFLGAENPQEEFVRGHLQANIRPLFLRKAAAPTIVKRRFIEESLAIKLFEVYEIDDHPLEEAEEQEFCCQLAGLLPEYDLVIVADYGHGLFSDKSIDLICDRAKFLAVNVQTNAGNRGFNFVSKYPRADYVSIDEPEARLELRNQEADINSLIEMLAEKMSCPSFMVTRGKHGTVLFTEGSGFSHTPVFSVNPVDRIGAGDACLALTAPCAALSMPPEIIGFLGNVAGAEACAVVGNKAPIDPTSLIRHVSSLLK